MLAPVLSPTRPGIKLHIVLATAASLLVALAILNRWIVVPLGLESYGRVWQLLVSYTDFGFVRRGLIGSALDLSGLFRLIPNEYLLALFVHSAFLVLFAALLCGYMISSRLTDLRVALAVLFAPTMLTHLGYNTGSLDIFLMALVLLNMLFVRNLILFSVLVITGILIHEVFLFLLPAQLLAYAIRKPQQTAAATSGRLLAPLLLGLATTALVTWLGQLKIEKSDYEAIMSDRMPNSYGNHGSGWGELTSAAQPNVSAPIEAFFTTSVSGLPLQFLPFVYLALVLLRLVSVASNKAEAFWFFVAVIFPLGAALVASDYYRWISMSANAGLLLVLLLSTSGRATKPFLDWLILSFALLGPFGAAGVERPFPLLQFLLEAGL